MDSIFLPRTPEGMELAQEVFRLEYDDNVTEAMLGYDYKKAHQQAFANTMLALVADGVLPKFVTINELEDTLQSMDHLEFKYQGKSYHIAKGEYKNMDKAFDDAQALAAKHNAHVEDMKEDIQRRKKELGERILRHLKTVYPEQYANVPSGLLHLDFELGGFVVVTKLNDETHGTILDLFAKMKDRLGNLNS